MRDVEWLTDCRMSPGWDQRDGWTDLEADIAIWEPAWDYRKKRKTIHVCMCNNYVCTQKWISSVFTSVWASLECYWPNTSQSTRCNTTVGARCYTAHSNIWLFILNWGIGYLVHSILILQLRWHLEGQLFPDLQFPTLSAMQMCWSKSWHRPVFNIYTVAEMRSIGRGEYLEKKVRGQTYMQIISWLFFSFFNSWNDTSQGQTVPAAFDIPGKARRPYQAEQVRCKVGTRGRSFSRWIPNVKGASKPWEMRRDIKATVPRLWEDKDSGGRKSTGGKEKKKKQVAALQSRKVLWIMGDNVTADFCRGSQRCSVSFFMDSVAHFFPPLFFFFFYTAINNPRLQVICGVKITALSSWNRSCNDLS